MRGQRNCSSAQPLPDQETILSMAIPRDYEEKVYAGVLGKIIGVYLGRPFEGWAYERIMAELGEIDYYVHEKLKAPLVVTDDDISGTFTFLRALPDYANNRDITPAQIGQTWLNYIIENRTILWWGGMGMSTEHTAFLRLKKGIEAPASGSIATNGRVVAEQIGSQIFIDGWGMVAPGDPELAADLARRAASVSHDGEAIYGAQVIAALEAQAFVEQDIDRLLDAATSVIPRASIIFQLISELREWHADEKDWRLTREKIAAKYGYDKFGGNCHIVPNHALVIHALLHGEGDFSRSQMIVNTCGWDTDCNAANVGCLLGIRNGLAGLESGPDWRGPVADRLYLPTADGGRCISDALREAFEIINIARAWNAQTPLAPKNGARFHFEMPGAVQGFQADQSAQSRGTLEIENVANHSEMGARSLALRFKQMATGRVARASVATFLTPEAVAMGGYGMVASPTLYAGQTIRARISCGEENPDVTCRLFIGAWNDLDELVYVGGLPTSADAMSTHAWQWKLDARELGIEGMPICQVGVEITSQARADGVIYLDYLTWDGAPDVHFKPLEGGKMWRGAWVDGADSIENWGGADYAIKQSEGTGLLIQGAREWTDYEVKARVSPHMARSAGIAVRVQGMKRFYALLLCPGNRARLVKALDGEHTLGETDFSWQLDGEYELVLRVEGNKIKASIDGRMLFDLCDEERPLAGGAIALLCEEGHTKYNSVQVRPPGAS